MSCARMVQVALGPTPAMSWQLTARSALLGRRWGKASEALTWGAELQGVPQNPVIKINNIIMRNLKKSKRLQQNPDGPVVNILNKHRT